MQYVGKKNAHDHAKSELDNFRLKMKECDTQISSILKEQQELQRKISETNLERKRMENEVTCYVPCVFSAYSGSNSDTLFPVFFPPRQVRRMETDQKDCSLKVQKLIEKHAWITSEKQLFGRSGTDYDFASRDPHKAKKDFEKLQADQSGYDHIVLFGHVRMYTVDLHNMFFLFCVC